MHSEPADTGQLSEDVTDFIVREIGSVAELEALLLVRAEPATSWDAPGLATRLYVDAAEAFRVIEALRARGFVHADNAGKVRYAASPDVEARIADVATAYRRFLIPITNIIHGKARSSAQQFADAFRLREKHT